MLHVTMAAINIAVTDKATTFMFFTNLEYVWLPQRSFLMLCF